MEGYEELDTLTWCSSFSMWCRWRRASRAWNRTGSRGIATGILEIVDEGFGFLRRHGVMPSNDDIYVVLVPGAALRPADR